METFGLTLARLLRARKCSVSAWARQVGITQGYASNLILGRRNPPFDRGLAWAKRFKLAAGELQDFLDLVALSHLPPPYRARLQRLKAENERLHWLLKRQRTAKSKAKRTVR
jgi:transcriptional regulator with XRE-family HTH domain